MDKLMDKLLLGMLNTPEIILILVLALILFGAKKLPDLAKGLGHGIKEFRKASREVSDELNNAMNVDSSPPPSPPRSYTPPPAEDPAPHSPSEGDSSDSRGGVG
jgi:sec-independent protein translocase protein TatA